MDSFTEKQTSNSDVARAKTRCKGHCCSIQRKEMEPRRFADMLTSAGQLLSV